MKGQPKSVALALALSISLTPFLVAAESIAATGDKSSNTTYKFVRGFPTSNAGQEAYDDGRFESRH
jgi:hypothetical protein